MPCQNQQCKSERIAHVHAHHSDCFSLTLHGRDCSANGYAPRIPDLCDGDDTEFEVCLECGQVQGSWPKQDPVPNKEGCGTCS